MRSAGCILPLHAHTPCAAAGAGGGARGGVICCVQHQLPACGLVQVRMLDTAAAEHPHLMIAHISPQQSATRLTSILQLVCARGNCKYSVGHADAIACIASERLCVCALVGRILFACRSADTIALGIGCVASGPLALVIQVGVDLAGMRPGSLVWAPREMCSASSWCSLLMAIPRCWFRWSHASMQRWRGHCHKDDGVCWFMRQHLSDCGAHIVVALFFDTAVTLIMLCVCATADRFTNWD